MLFIPQILRYILNRYSVNQTIFLLSTDISFLDIRPPTAVGLAFLCTSFSLTMVYVLHCACCVCCFPIHCLISAACTIFICQLSASEETYSTFFLIYLPIFILYYFCTRSISIVMWFLWPTKMLTSISAKLDTAMLLLVHHRYIFYTLGIDIKSRSCPGSLSSVHQTEVRLY